MRLILVALLTATLSMLSGCGNKSRQTAVGVAETNSSTPNLRVNRRNYNRNSKRNHQTLVSRQPRMSHSTKPMSRMRRLRQSSARSFATGILPSKLRRPLKVSARFLR